MDNPLRVRFGPFHLDEANAQLRRAGRPVDLQPKELAVLCELARRPGQLVTKDQLLDAVWGHLHVSESVLKTIVSHLRAALDDDARAPRCIETVSRRGYRFVAALQRGEAGAAGAPGGEGSASTGTAPAIAAGGAASLIGREAPLARLRAALQAGRGGRRQLMFVAGEAGIGKTTLVDAFAAEAAAEGAAVARGQCVEHYGAAEPYMPVLEAVDLLARADPRWLALLRDVAPSWLAQMPWHLGGDERRELQREVAGSTQERMLREMGELLDRGAALSPLVLVLEDLHWSDHATVQLLGYLARRRAPAALLLVGSFRPAEVIAEAHPLSGVRQELRVQRLADEIDLEAFSEAEVGALLRRRLAAREGAAPEVPESLVLALHAHTGGLPLFVSSMLDELVDGDDGRHESAAAGGPARRLLGDAVELTVPARVADVLLMRFGRLDGAVQQALSVASVAGAEFVHLPLARALQTDADTLQRLLDAEAGRGRWLREAGVMTLPEGGVAARYAFRHGLYQHVLYERLSAAERVRWHRALGEALLALHGARPGEAAGELALHFDRGRLPLAAMGQYVHVARRALARGAAREALKAVQRGLALAAEAAGTVLEGNGREAIEVELDLRVLEGVALSRVHVLVAPEVAEAFERTRRLCAQAPASPARARAQHGLWWVSFGRGELADACRLAQELLDAAAAVGEPGLALAGASTMGLTRSLCGDFPAAREHLERAVALSDRLGDSLQPGMFVQDPSVEARAHLAALSWWQGEPALARRHAADAVARAGAIRHRLSEIIAWHFAAAVHCFAGEMREARECTGHLFEVIREHGLPSMPGTFSWLHGRALAACGEVEEGLALMHAAESSCRALGLLVGITGFHYHLAEALRSAGRHAEALASARRGLDVARAGPEKYVLSPLLRLQAEECLAAGDAAAAADAMAESLEVARRQGGSFFELQSLVAGLRLGLLHGREPRDRLGELLAPYEGEQIAAAREARALLAAA